MSVAVSPRSRYEVALDLAFPPPVLSRWYCERPGCDGEPHGVWGWKHARAKQRPPWLDDVSCQALIWLVMAGRGFGKTRVGAEWIAHEARERPATEWAIVAPTFKDLREVCIEGDSGLLSVLDGTAAKFNRSTLEIRLENGSVFHCYSAEAPERVRGPNLAGAWMDEIAQAEPNYMRAYRNLSMAIRKRGAPVRLVGTTTPDRKPLVRELAGREDGSVVVTQGSTFENRTNLADEFIAEMEVRHAGTRFERQELYGELLEDVPGALWQPAQIAATRAVLVD